MNDDGRVVELHKQFASEQSKYTYFLLAVAASCIALAVRSTADAAASWSLVPLLFAVVFWAYSFLRGLKFIECSQIATRANVDHLLFLQGEHPLAGMDLQKAKYGADQSWNRANELSTAASKHFTWQFRYLVAGGALYISWHILAIALRTAPGA